MHPCRISLNQGSQSACKTTVWCEIREKDRIHVAETIAGDANYKKKSITLCHCEVRTWTFPNQICLLQQNLFLAFLTFHLCWLCCHSQKLSTIVKKTWALKLHSTSCNFTVINGIHLYVVFFQLQMPFIAVEHNPIPFSFRSWLKKRLWYLAFSFCIKMRQ